MPEPALTVLGVYKPDIPEDVYREQWRVSGSDEQTQQHFARLVLIEAIVENAEGRFKAVELGQLYEGFFQCAYDEALLSADGQVLTDRRMDCVSGTGPLRFAFYLHFYDPEKPLDWSCGQVQCPPLRPVSDRLRQLVPYNACN
jgi:hypothetical protein